MNYNYFNIKYLTIFCLIGTLAFSSSYAADAKDAVAATQNSIQNLNEKDIARFTTAISEIKDFYVQQIDDKKLLEDAIRGMLTGLDPHSEYLDEEAYKTLLMSTSGEFGGLGIEVTPEYGVLKVISPIDDTPASKAGIKAGDYIVALDGKLVNEMTLREAVDKMRGKKGTPISLTILRKGEKEPINYKLVRDTIQMKSIKSKMLDDNFGYVRISQFQQPTTELLISAIEELKKSAGGNLKGLILDLRNNPGGLLETAVQVADIFLDSKNTAKFNKVIVYTEGRLPKVQYTAKSSGSDILNGAPIVILINEGSASASEIVAGALQDYQRATIVGKTSFGKGSVQTVLPLDNTHAIKLTTALYHTPSGRVIQNIGITPDITVDNLKIVAITKPDNAILEPLKEFELKGHLKNTQTADLPKSKLDDSGSDTATSTLAQDDFQLYEAEKILKTIAMVEKGISKPTVTPAAQISQKDTRN